MKISAAERTARALRLGTLTEAADQLRGAGYVILERVLPPDWVDELAQALELSIRKNRGARLRPERARRASAQARCLTPRFPTG